MRLWAAETRRLRLSKFKKLSKSAHRSAIAAGTQPEAGSISADAANLPLLAKQMTPARAQACSRLRFHRQLYRFVCLLRGRVILAPFFSSRPG